MDLYQQLESLLELASEVGITLRRLAGPAAGAEYPGGALVRLRGKDVLFLDSTAAIADQLAVTAADIERAAKVHLVTANRVVFVTSPAGGGAGQGGRRGR